MPSVSGELTLPAVPTPPLPEPGEEVRPAEPRGRDQNARGSEIIIKSDVRDSVSGFQCIKAEESASHGRKDVLRTIATHAMTFVAEGKSGSGNVLGK